MQTAIEAEGMCWTLGPTDLKLVDASNPHASMSARNNEYLDWYAEVVERKGVTVAVFVAALRTNLDGDPAPLQAIFDSPDA